MSSFTRITLKVLNKLWMLAAVMLLSIAVLISALRLALPHMDEQKHWVEDWVGKQYGANLSIGEITADWQGAGPAIVLKNVRLNTDTDSPVQLHIGRTNIEINFWQSVLSGQLHSRQFHLRQLQLTLDTDAIKAGDSDEPILDALQHMFLHQLQRFSVRSSALILKRGKRQQRIELEQLNWHNQGTRHLAEGALRVDELASNSAYFALELRGDKDDLDGVFYAKGKDLDLSPWLSGLLHEQQELHQTRVNFDLWAAIEANHIQLVEMQLQPSFLSWGNEEDEEIHKAVIHEGRLLGKPQNPGWLFNLNDLRVKTDGNPDFVSSWQASSSLQQGISIATDKLELTSLLPLASMALSPGQYRQLMALSPDASIEGLRLRLGQQQSVRLSLDELSWRASGQLPGMQGLSGEFNWHNGKGHLSLLGEVDRLDSFALLGRELFYEKFELSLYLSQQAEGLALHADKFNLFAGEFWLNNRFSYRKGNLTWLGEVSPMSVDSVKGLLPGELLGPTKDYLQDALQDGQLGTSRILWHGKPEDYPFANQQGIFQAQVQFSELDFRFNQQWPALTSMRLGLLFENEKLLIGGEQGRLMDMPVQRVDALIDDLRQDSVLYINTDIQAPGEQIAAILNNSMLKDSVGEVLNQVQVGGQVTGKLDLTIPLSGDDVVARGDLALNNNTVTVPQLGLTLEGVTGPLRFTNGQIETDTLQTRLLNQPLTLVVKGYPRGEEYLTDITLAGSGQWQGLLKAHKPSLQPYLDGTVEWQGDLNLRFPDEGYSFDLAIDSTLMGTQSSLPAPFAKVADQSMPLHLLVNGDDEGSQVRMMLGPQVKFSGYLDNQSGQFARAHLAIGEDDFVGLGSGFTIAAKLERAAFDQWFDAVDALLETSNDNDVPGPFAVPTRIFVNAGALDALGQRLLDVQINARHMQDKWQVGINGEQIRARVDLFHRFLQEGVVVEADYLMLPRQESLPSLDFKVNAASLPPLSLHCKSCKLGSRDLGEIMLRMDPTASGMHVRDLKVSMPEGQLTAKGDWFVADNGQSTRLEGRFISGDFGAFLKDFDIDSGIRDSDASVNFDLSWQQAPYDFELASLAGKVDWRLGDGYLADLSDKGARLFAVLSLRSLIRKLQLDFRDVFSKGFFYDKMRGDFDVKNGQVSTTNTKINGAAGDMLLKGYTDLNTRKIDYEINFTPKITSSLPVIMAWLASPPAALAALALDEMLTSAKVISNIDYKLTGTLDDPVLSELGRKSKDVALPARKKSKAKGQPGNENSGAAPEPGPDSQTPRAAKPITEAD